jgi:hypothetical protein
MYLKEYPPLPTPRTLGGGDYVNAIAGDMNLVTSASESAPVPLRAHAWVPTRAVAKQCNWRHDNILRALKQFVRFKYAELSDRNSASHDLWLLERGDKLRAFKFMVVHEVSGESAPIWPGALASRGILAGDKGQYAVALPVWQEFVAWLLKHTVKFSDRQKRLRSLGFKPTTEAEREMAVLSGLEPITPGKLPETLVRVIYKGFIYEPQLVDLTYREKEPEGAVTFTGFADDKTVGVDALAAYLNYTPRRLGEVLEHAVTYLPAEDVALIDAPGGKRMSYKAAMYLLLKLRKAQKQRLAMFNTLFARLQTPKLELKEGEIDYNNPRVAKQACLQLQEALGRTAEELRDAQRTKVELDSQLRVALADKAGLEAKAAQLEKGLVQSAAAGNLAADGVDDHIVRNSSQLRREHHLMGKKDVLQDLSRYLHDHVQSGLLLNQADMFAMMTWWTCEKLRDANGAPVIRHSMRQNDFARRYQVYASGAGQEGAFFKNGASSKTSWMVFFTPKGIEEFRTTFSAERTRWLELGKPKSCLDRSTLEAVPEVLEASIDQ